MKHVNFDGDELRQLALNAMGRDRLQEALGLLKQASDKAPDDAEVHYLTGAVHAQIGLYQRAMADMERAIRLSPGLHPARFQLGLLHMTSADPAKASEVWTELDTLGKDHPFVLLKTGLEHLAKDEFDSAIDYLARGIEANADNPALNHDMEKVLAAARQALGAAPAPAAKPGSHVLLSSYRRDDTEH